MNQSIFLNNVVDLVNEIATFLHNFLLFLTPDPSKQLTICVFAGLTRNLILALSNATRCVPTPFIDRNAGSAQRKKMRKNTWIVPRRLLNESERFR